MIVDTHCHLNFDSFQADLREVIFRAGEAGVERMLNPGIDLASSRAAVTLAERWPGVFAAVGVHPNDASGWQDAWLEELEALARRPKVVAIGEIGLDNYWDSTPAELQEHVLRRQLALAARLELPVVIHCRDKHPPDGPAIQNLLAILAEWQQDLERNHSPLARRPGVLHSFSGDLQSAQRAVDMNFMIGITGPITFKKAELLRRMVAELPETTLLIETDAPFLTPHPHRGKRNEPAYVRYVLEKVAEVRQMDVIQMAQITSSNAETLFGWK